MTQPDQLAVAFMIGYCGWDPTTPVTNATVTLDGNGTPLLTLPSLYVTDVSAVTVTDPWGTVTAPTVGPGPTLNDAGAVGWQENGCLTWNGCGVWPTGQRNITVTYSGGYTDTPNELTQALLSLSRRTSNPTLMGATSLRMGTAGVNYGQQLASGDLLMVEKMVFDRFRLPGAA